MERKHEKGGQGMSEKKHTDALHLSYAELVERLRRKAFTGPTMEATHLQKVEWLAADAIETLEAEVRDLTFIRQEWEAAVTEAHARGYREGLERAAAECEAKIQEFLDSAYAGHPINSFGERFACGQCADAIRALILEAPDGS